MGFGSAGVTGLTGGVWAFEPIRAIGPDELIFPGIQGEVLEVFR